MSQETLALNEEADEQRCKSKHAQNATEHYHQPSSPATVVLDLKPDIREIPPRHRAS
jgi:hypothetical protein